MRIPDGWFWRLVRRFRPKAACGTAERTGVLDANQLFKIEFFDDYFLCLDLLNSVTRGCEGLRWNEREGYVVAFGPDGRERSMSVPGIDRETTRNMASYLSNGVESIAHFEASNPSIGRFELVIKDHHLEVQVERSQDASDPTVVLRFPGASRLYEEARCLLKKLMDERGDLSLWPEGSRTRIGHGPPTALQKIAGESALFVHYGTLVLSIGICCYLYDQSSWRAEAGLSGFVLSVALGLLLGVILVRGFHWVFGPEDEDWFLRSPEKGVESADEGR